MLIYAGTKSDFMIDTENDRLETKLYENIKLKMNRTTGLSELNAWRNSLKEMYITLNDSDIPEDAGVAIEYNIPQTSKRVDFLISGYGWNGKGNVVIVELKQWEKLASIDGQDAIVETYTGGANRRVVHPCYQAWSYAALIRDYNEYVQDNEIGLHPCAYLHNYPRSENDPLDKEQYQDIMEETPAFTYGQRESLRTFIKKQIVTGDKEDTLLKIEHGKIKPSKQLQDALVNMLKGNQEFVMLDEQKVVYESILDYSCQCQKDGKKRTIIVEGGPGTGKTVVAINLLAELTNRMQFVQYVSKNAAPRTVYQFKLKGHMRKNSVDNLFKGSGSYTEAPRNSVGTLLADEAHRLNEKSGMFQNMGENQIKEIIHAAACSVFFIDESQRVTLSDIGSVAEIEKWAALEKSEVIKMQLVSQFRCNGSSGINILWPITSNEDYKTELSNAKDGKSPNNISPIIKYSLNNGVTVLWFGDLENTFMEKIKDLIELPKADIIFAPHHGRSSGKIPKEWMESIDPKIVVIGEAPSEKINYLSGYNTITQNTAGNIIFDCDTGIVDVYVSNEKYSVDFLKDKKKSNKYNGKYIGSLDV